MIEVALALLEVVFYICIIFVTFMVVLGPIFEMILDIFLPFDDFDDFDGDDGYGF